MTAIATILQTLYLAYRNAHHLATGVGFVGDHEFFGESYKAVEDEYDSVVERTIGLGLAIDLVKVQMEAAALLAAMEGETWAALLKAEQTLQAEIDQVNARGSWSAGTNNLLSQIADESEQRAYKLQQRMKP